LVHGLSSFNVTNNGGGLLLPILPRRRDQ
jgi:hypothetical protein